MESYKLRVPTLDFLYRETALNSQVSSEAEMTRDFLMIFNARKYS